jgi:ubiquinone/menaquinone biosynthesis C-methylase UbiE
LESREYFERTLPEWEEVYRRPTLYATIYRERLRAALQCVEDLALAPGSAVVDIGCGPGFGTAELARRDFRVVAMDASAQMVKQAIARARSSGVGSHVRGCVADIRALPLGDGTQSLAFVIGVSEWLESLEAPHAEIARILRPGGWLVLSADNPWALSCLLDPLENPMVVPMKRAAGRALRRVWPRRKAIRTQAHSRRTIDEALRRAGLETTKRTTLGFGPLTFFHRGLLPERTSQALHHRLSALASRPTSLLAATGLTQITVARRALH